MLLSNKPTKKKKAPYTQTHTIYDIGCPIPGTDVAQFRILDIVDLREDWK